MDIVKPQEVETSPHNGDIEAEFLQDDSYQFIDILRVSTCNPVVAEQFKERIENAKKLASVKTLGSVSTDMELLDFLLSSLESFNTDKPSKRSGQNVMNIQEAINNQMKINASDDMVVYIGDKPVFINKRFISSAWVQKTLKCSFASIKSWFDNPDNQALLDKHHVKHGIVVNHNRLVVKAMRAKIV